MNDEPMSPTPEPPNPPWHRVGPAHEYEIRAAEQAGYRRGLAESKPQSDLGFAKSEYERGVREQQSVLEDVIRRCAPAGTQDDMENAVGFYVLPTGPVHRALTHLQAHGSTVQPCGEVGLISRYAAEEIAFVERGVREERAKWVGAFDRALMGIIRAERDAEIRQHIEEMLGRLAHPTARTSFQHGRSEALGDLLDWMGEQS